MFRRLYSSASKNTSNLIYGYNIIITPRPLENISEVNKYLDGEYKMIEKNKVINFSKNKKVITKTKELRELALYNPEEVLDRYKKYIHSFFKSNCTLVSYKMNLNKNYIFDRGLDAEIIKNINKYQLDHLSVSDIKRILLMSLDITNLVTTTNENIATNIQKQFPEDYVKVIKL